MAVGEDVIDVPPTLAARVRLSSSHKTSKNDPNDLSTAIAGLRHCGLRRVDRDDHTAVLRLLADRHHELTGLRTQAACRLHVMFRELTPGGAPLRIKAAHGHRLLTAMEPTDPVALARIQIALEHLADIGRLDGEIVAVTQRITIAAEASGTKLTELHGVGPVTAARCRLGACGRARPEARRRLRVTA